MKVAYFPKFDWPRIENPYIRFPEAEHLAETEAAEARAIAAIEAAVAANPDDIAGLIIEPIQGEGRRPPLPGASSCANSGGSPTSTSSC